MTRPLPCPTQAHIHRSYTEVGMRGTFVRTLTVQGKSNENVFI